MVVLREPCRLKLLCALCSGRRGGGWWRERPWLWSQGELIPLYTHTLPLKICGVLRKTLLSCSQLCWLRMLFPSSDLKPRIPAAVSELSSSVHEQILLIQWEAFTSPPSNVLWVPWAEGWQQLCYMTCLISTYRIHTVKCISFYTRFWFASAFILSLWS